MRTLNGQVRMDVEVMGTSALKAVRAVPATPVSGGFAPGGGLRYSPRRGHLVLLPGGAAGVEARRPVRARDLSAPSAPCPADPVRALPAPVGLRLTRRGRRVARTAVGLAGLTVAAAVVCLLMAAGLLNDPAAPTVAPRPLVSLQQPVVVDSQVTVAPGESLWTVAARVAPGVDRVEAMDALRAANGLTSARLQAGQALRVPPALQG